tara:strand:- start:76 stop:288 length:213 start_codon:yes stop_codon:yes gene_type:complete
MTRYKNLNGEQIKFTPEEEIERDNEESQALIDAQAREDAKINAETKKASGKQKLIDLGLNEDEIKALIGV